MFIDYGKHSPNSKSVTNISKKCNNIQKIGEAHLEKEK